jgi:hypothetical protein
MPKEIGIKVTQRGFDVTIGGRTSAFTSMEQALSYVHERLQRTIELRDLSYRCE